MFVTEFHGTETIELTAAASEVFDLLIDVEHLPDWNAHVHHVITPPDQSLTEGVEWVIQMRAMGTTWPSRARALTVDHAARQFEYRSCSDDGNPTYGLWSWQVVPTPGGCTLSVSWSIHPLSFWRKLLFARLRRPVLADEVHASVGGLDNYLVARRSGIEHPPG